MRFTGSDRIVWGTDSAGYGAQIGAAVLGLRDFQMPEELQWQYGYLPLTDEDKGKIFGGNLAGHTSVQRAGQTPATFIKPILSPLQRAERKRPNWMALMM